MDKKEKIDWWRIFSPCILGIIFCLFALLVSLDDVEFSNAWGMLVIFLLLPPILGLAILDSILKLLIRVRIRMIWLIETVAVVIVVYLYAGYYFF